MADNAAWEDYQRNGTATKIIAKPPFCKCRQIFIFPQNAFIKH